MVGGSPRFLHELFHYIFYRSDAFNLGVLEMRVSQFMGDRQRFHVLCLMKELITMNNEMNSL